PDGSTASVKTYPNGTKDTELTSKNPGGGETVVGTTGYGSSHISVDNPDGSRSTSWLTPDGELSVSSENRRTHSKWGYTVNLNAAPGTSTYSHIYNQNPDGSGFNWRINPNGTTNKAKSTTITPDGGTLNVYQFPDGTITVTTASADGKTTSTYAVFPDG